MSFSSAIDAADCFLLWPTFADDTAAHYHFKFDTRNKPFLPTPKIPLFSPAKVGVVLIRRKSFLHVTADVDKIIGVEIIIG